MVAAPWRRLAHAATWNGHPPQATTGAARARASHCQSSNWSAGTIDRATTGRVSRPMKTSPSRTGRRASPSSSGVVAATRVGTRAPYPTASTWATRSSVVTPFRASMEAVSVTKLTVAATPSRPLRRFSMRAAQEAQVMPSTTRSTWPVGAVIPMGGILSRSSAATRA